jgi:tol-pal system protein YbgF
MKKSIGIFVSATVLLVFCAAPRAFAVSKEIIQLQTQVQQLQDAVLKMQLSNTEQIGVLKSLLQQTTDNVNSMSASMTNLQKTMSQQQDAQSGKLDQVSGQIQALNDSVDELQARLDKINKQLQDIENQQQSINAAVQQNLPQPGGVAGTAQQPNAAGAPLDNAAPSAPPAPAAPPVEQLYQTAYGDYNAGNITLAASEFGDVIKYYPDNNLSGNAYFYLGEIQFKAHKYVDAIKNYNKVLSGYPGNNKIPSAQLRRGQSLIAVKQTEAGIKELRSLIQRYPNSPEAMAARSRLNGMGVRIR